MQVVAAVLCWGAWALGLLAIVVPRPAGLTAVRTIAPCFAVLAVVVVASGAATGPGAATAVGATVVAAVLVARPPLAFAAANAAAYGDELRFPLRTPPALFLGPLPAVRLLTGTAIATGPLLLADTRWVLGGVAVLVAVPVVLLGGRALHGLSTRWAVLVPAGFVIVDPLTLADPVLFPRERITVLARCTEPTPDPDDGSLDPLDLRLGATLGSLTLRLDRPAEVHRALRSRRGATLVRATEVRVAVTQADRLLGAAAARRIRTAGVPPSGQAATPPPTNSSPT
jgi:hypothetical protein